MFSQKESIYKPFKSPHMSHTKDKGRKDQCAEHCRNITELFIVRAESEHLLCCLFRDFSQVL